MKKFLFAFAIIASFAVQSHAQNLTTVSASNITDINGTKLAAGQLCFLITDNQDNPISISIGGGGQALKRGYCSAVTAGVVTTFSVPNPANTSPMGIYYRVTVKDSSTGQEVLRYALVSFTGATFNFDNYAPTNLASAAPLTGTVVNGNLSGNGNATFTGTVTGSNIPSSIIQQIFSAGIGQTQRTGVNFFSGITCSDNAGTSRTDCRPGTLNAVAFSATPTFDCTLGSVQKLTLTGNVTSSSLANCQAGQLVAFEICQDATGGRTFANPAGLNQWSALPIAANACAVQQYSFDALNVGFPDMMPALTGDVTSSATSTVTTLSRIQGTTVTGTTGSGAAVLASSPTLVTPNIGTATATSVTVTSANGTAFSGRSGATGSNITALSVGRTAQEAEVAMPAANGQFFNNADLAAGDMAVRLDSSTSRIYLGAGIGIAPVAITNSGENFYGSTSGSTTVKASAVASGTLTLPAATDTLVGKATTDTLT
ncbi:MAG TPA: hypothetical protein VGP89_06580, partial [Candidatus Angelobacter sp.]|nr:hypothetical protein [Candidatus Angelobacter sp.]